MAPLHLPLLARLALGATLGFILPLAGAAAPGDKDAKKAAEEETEFKRVYPLCNDNWAPKNVDQRIESCNVLLTRFLPGKNPHYALNDVGLPTTWESLAYAFYVKKDLKLASNAANEALKLRTTNNLSYMVRGWTKMETNDFAGAIADFTIADKLHSWVEQPLLRGKVHYELKDYEASLTDLNAAVEGIGDKVDPAIQLDIYQARIATLQRLNRSDAVLADLRQLAKLEPTNPRWDRDTADLYLEQGKDKLALEAVERALVVDPEDRVAFALRHKIYAKSEDTSIRNVDKAIADLEKALSPRAATDNATPEQKIAAAFDSLNIGTHGSMSQLAELYAAKGNIKKAVETITASIAKRESDSDYALRSEWRVKLGQLDEAEADANKAVELGKKAIFKSAGPEALARVYIARGDLQKGLDYLGATISNFIDEVSATALIRDLPAVKTREEAEARAAAIAQMVSTLKPTPKYPAIGSQLRCSAGFLMEDYDTDKALQLLSSNAPGTECSDLGSARLYGARRDFAKELEMYNRFLGAHPDSFDTLEGRGRLHVAMGNLELAAKDADEMARIKPRDGSSIVLRALISEAKGDFTESLLAGDGMTKSYQRWGAGHDLMARSYLKLGKLDKAEESANKAIALAGSNDLRFYQHTLARIQQAQGKADDAWLTFIKTMNGKWGRLVAAYQFSLKEAGLYQGAVDGKKTPELDKAIDACVHKAGCSIDGDR